MTTQFSRSTSRSTSFIRLGRFALHGLFALLALVPAVAVAAPNLAIQFNAGSPPGVYNPASYVPGQSVDIRLVLTNPSGAEVTAGSAVAVALASLPAGVTVSNRNCVSAGTGSVCGTLPTGPGAALVGSGSSAIAVGGSLTITARLNFASSVTGTQAFTVEASATGGSDASAQHSFSADPQADLEVEVTRQVSANPPAEHPDCPINELTTYTRGCAAAYTVGVRNNGPSDAGGASLSISRSEAAGATFTWTCASNSYAACPATNGSGPLGNVQVGTFASGGELIYTVTVTHALTDTHADVGITAGISAPAGVTEIDTNNNTHAATRTRNSSANLSAVVTPAAVIPEQAHCPGQDENIYTPGCARAYTVVVANAGPDAANGATLNLARSEGTGLVFQWACVPAGGAVCPEPHPETEYFAADLQVALGNLPAGSTLTYTLMVGHLSSELFPKAGVEASVIPPANRVDIDLRDNTPTVVERDIKRRAALRVVKRAVQNGVDIQEVFANDAFDYEITVHNLGPSDVGNIGSDLENPQIDPDGPALVLDDAFDSRLMGLGVGSCTPSSGQPCWTFCPSTLGWEGSPGEGADIADAGNCPVDAENGSSQALSERFSLRAGSGSRLLARVYVPSVTGEIKVGNMASVSLSSCDPPSAAGCHAIDLVGQADALSSSVDVDIIPAASARVTVENVNDGEAVPGTRHSYTIKVQNTGTYNLSQTEIRGAFPLAQGGNLAGFVPGSVSYQCKATNGACCFSGGSCGLSEATQPVFGDAMSVLSSLPASSELVFTVSGTVDPRALDPMKLVASAEPNGGAERVEDEANTTMSPRHNLRLSKRLVRRYDAGLDGVEVDPEAACEGEGNCDRHHWLRYEILAYNDGPSHAVGAALADGDGTVVEPAHFAFAHAHWTCQAVAAPGIAPEASLCDRDSGIEGIGDTVDGPLLLNLMPGDHAVVHLDVPITESAGSQVANRATFAIANGAALEASVLTTLSASYTLQVQKDDGLEVAHPGALHTYSITVLNEGPDDAYDVLVRDTMPAALQSVQWTCSAISPVPGDLALMQAAVNAPGEPGKALVLSADGRHIYVIGSRDFGGESEPDIRAAIFAYQRNATPGLNYGEVVLDPIDTEIQGIDDITDTSGVVQGLGDPSDLVLTPDGSVLYVLTRGVPDNDPESTGQWKKPPGIVTFHRVTQLLDPEFGRLSFAGFTETTLSHPRRIVATASHVYVAGSMGEAGAGQVQVFRPDATSRLPIAIPAASVTAPAVAGPMLLSREGDQLFVASTTSSAIVRYAIATSGPEVGRLTQDGESGAAETGFAGIGDMVLAPNGRDLYVFAHNGGSPRIGHVGVGTGLVFGPHYGDHSAALLGGAVRLALSPDGEHLIGVSPVANAMFMMRRNPVTGALTGGASDNPDVEQQLFRDGSPGVTGLDAPMALAVSPDNRHVMVASGSTTGDTGPLAVFSRRAPAPQLGFIEHDRDGDDIPDGKIDSLVAPSDVITHGRFVYALSKVDSAVNLFERRVAHVGPEDEDGGHLTFISAWRNGQGGISGLANPDRMLVSPDGRTLFVSSRDGYSLAVFRRDSGNGMLTFAGAFQRSGGYPGLQGAYGMAMDADSKYLYVAGSYEATIAIFRHDGQSPGRLSYHGAVIGGQNGVTGMNGIRDLAVAGRGDAAQLIGVSETANTAVVFNGAGAGSLSFVQAHALGNNQRPMALALSPATDNNAHVYVAAQNSNTVHVLRRVLDSTSTQFGRVQAVAQVTAGGLAPSSMAGPRDVAVSADGKHVYVAAQFGHSLVAFSRFGNPGSAQYGHLTFTEARTQNIDAVDGIRAPYAVAVSPDSRNVYVAGFGSDAVASFSVGTGSSCSASGSGDIEDVVTIRAGGAVMYHVQSIIRPDASGTLLNIATVQGESTDTPDTCAPGDAPGLCAADETQLLTSAKLEISKTNNQVAVVPGTEVIYDITVRNVGPGNVTGLGDPGAASVTDLFGCQADGVGGYDCPTPPMFDIGTVSWTCSASSSGLVDFLAAYREVGAEGESTGISHLGGIASLALIPAGSLPDTTRVRGNFLVGASVDDDALVFFRRDAATGALTPYLQLEHDEGTTPPRLLGGARSVAVSQDGRLLFVASRRSDSLTVFELSGSNDEPLIVSIGASTRNPLYTGLDQALHVITLPAADGREHVYVAGANDHAVAMFAYRSSGSGTPAALEYIGSQVNGAGAIQGLSDVEFLVASPDGAQVYALSGSSASVAQFNRNASTGELTYVARFTGGGALPLTGVSSATFDATGKYLYLTVAGANRLAFFSRVSDAASGEYGKLEHVSSLAQGEQGVQGLLNPRRAALSADGQHLYVTSQAGATLAWFSLHPDTGVPAYQGIRSNQSSGVQGLAGATGLVLDPQLNQLYVAGTLDKAIVHFQRQSDSWCPPSGTGPLDAVPVNIAAGGHVAFRVKVGVSALLDPDTGLVNRADVNWRSASCSGEGGTSEGACDQHAIDTDAPSNLADLSITKDDGLAEYDGLAGAVAMAADVHNIYVAAPGDNGIGMFQRQADAPADIGLRYLGALRSGASGVSGLAGVADILASADGRHVYAVSPVDNAITSFVRHASTGRLTQIDQDQNGVLGVTGMSGARALVMSGDGEHVYVAGGFSNSVAIFRRNSDSVSPDFGTLSFMASIQAGVGNVNGIESPVALALSQDQKSLYVLGGAGDTLVVFARQSNSGSGAFGQLQQVARYQNASGGVLGMDEVRSLVLSEDDAHLYVLGSDAGSLVHFSRDADSDGRLSFVPHSDSQAVFMASELVGATRLRMGSDGRLYAASAAQDAIAVLDLDDEGKPALAHLVRNGDDSPMASVGLVDGLAGAADVAVVSKGADLWLYAVGATDAALTAFDFDQGAPRYHGAIIDGLGGVAPGDDVEYTIVVSNHGPSHVMQARVVDSFPPEFEHVRWTCTGYSASCPASAGDGNLDVTVTLPYGSYLEFKATGTVGSKASGRLVNTATVQAIGVLDPDMSNNSATDDDTVLSPSMDLSIQVDDNGCDLSEPGCQEVTQATPGGDISWRVQAANAGPTYAQGALVSDVLPAALYDVAWTCTPTPYAGLLQEVALSNEPERLDSYRAAAVDSLGRHVYAVGTRDDGYDAIVAFKRDPLTGVLTYFDAWYQGKPDAMAPPGIEGAIDIVITADGRFVYVAGQRSDAVSVFERDLDSGQLVWRSQVVDGEMGVDGIGGVSTLAISPDGRQLYAGGASDRAIAAFNINISSGALSLAGVIRQGAGVNGLNGVNDLAFDADGDLLFATAAANRSITAFRRNPVNGMLTHVKGIEDGDAGLVASLLSPSAVWVHEDRVFVTDAQGDAVNLLRFVDGQTPRFEVDEVIALDADGVDATQQPSSVVFVADQQRLYVASSASAQVHLYSLLDPAGAQHLASYDTAVSDALDRIAALVISPNERQLYAVSGGDDGLIATLSREAGSRCPLAGEGGLGSQRVDIAPGGFVQFDVSGRIFANATGNLTYSVAVDPRVLTHESQPIDNRASDTNALVPAPDLGTRKLRETADEAVIAGEPITYRIEAQNHGVSDALGAWMIDDLPLFPDVAAGLQQGSGEWSCDTNLPLAHNRHVHAALEPRIANLSAMAHSSDGRRWFGVSRSESALVDVRLDASGNIESVHRLVDGDDAGGETISGLAGASHLALSPDGAHLYVTAAESNSVLIFAVRGDGVDYIQRIVSGTQTPGLQGAAHVVVSADGRFVYTAAVPSTSGVNSAIVVFRRDAVSGELTYVELIRDGIATELNVIRGVRTLHPSADGRHLYAVSTVSQSLVRFDVDGAAGTLRVGDVLRGGAGAQALPALGGARDLVATPGDGQLYVLGDQGIALFSRALNGAVALVSVTPAPATNIARRLAMDTWGARLYLADAQGAVHLYARQWSDGALEHRFTLDGVADAEPGTLLHLPALGELVLTQAGEEGGLTRLVEQPVSRCMAVSGIEDELPAEVDLGVGGWSALGYTATVHPSARGTLRNVARTVPGSGFDPNPDNDEGIDEATILVVSDLAISKEGPAHAIAGEYVEYMITVTNAGPSNALGIYVKDDLDPAKFANASWTCAIEGQGNSFCNPTGSGATLDVLADLHVGDVMTVTLTVQVHPAWIGPLDNAAYLEPEPGSSDPTMDDHVAAPVITEVVRRADLDVGKTTVTAEVVAGLPVEYTVTVRNLGPSDAPQVRVQDFLPSMLYEASWTCATQLGSGDCGVASGTGSINREVAIPVGERLTWHISAMLRPSALGELSNTANARVLADGIDALDPDLSNNTDSVTDSVITRADLWPVVTAPDAYDPGSVQPMPYRIQVFNAGPSNAAESTVKITFSAPVSHSTEGCVPQSGAEIDCVIEAISAERSVVLDFGLSSLPEAPNTFTSNVQVASQTSDPLMTNNTAGSTTDLITGVDLKISIDDGLDGFAAGDETRYIIRVSNVGSVDAVGANVLVPLAAQLIDAVWTCNATGAADCTAAGSGDINDQIDLPAGASLTYLLDARLNPAIDILLHHVVEQPVQVQGHPDQVEVSDQNNTDIDINEIYKILFRDGFEDEPQRRRQVEGEPQAAHLRMHLLPLPDAVLPVLPACASVHCFASCRELAA